MNPTIARWPLLAVLITVLCACDRAPPTTAGTATATVPAAPRPARPVAAGPGGAYGFAIAVPAGMTLHHDFRRSYLGDDGWKAMAGPGSKGTAVLALVLDGSNSVTAAELRIGVSDDADALAHCRDVPSGIGQAAPDTRLSGTRFARSHAGDAAMSHYLDVDAYRTVHDGRCYAIDLLVTGTRPEVYDPPATPPFTRERAQQALASALAGFRFTD